MAALLAATAERQAGGANGYAPEALVGLLREIETPPDARSAAQLAARIAHAELLAGQTAAAVADYERLVATVDARPQAYAATFVDDLLSQAAIAQLRLGEQRNCIGHHAAESCILPIAGRGRHQEPAAARVAQQLLRRLLARHPGDLSARWLLTVATMAAGDAATDDPLLVPAAAWAAEAAAPRFVDVAPAAGLATLGLAGGVVTEDLDGDGLLDVMVSSWGWHDPLRFFHNRGDGTFAEQSERAGLSGLAGGLNLVHADYDNDGDADVLVLRGAWQGAAGKFPNSLLRNRGDGRFEDVTEAAGLLDFHPSQTAAWGDYDNDGWLDLYVGNESSPGERHPCRLFRNRGDGTFEDVTAATGLGVIGYVKAVAWGDVDGDGWLDLYVSRLDGPNRLFRNRGGEGDPGFADVTAAAGVAEPIHSFPAWFFDADDDGDLDLFVSGFAASYGEASLEPVVADALGLPTDAERLRLYRNRGDGTFDDVTAAAGLARVVLTMGSNFGDLDADGDLDLYLGTGAPDLRVLIPNRAFLNQGGRFADVTTTAGLGHLQKGHAIAFADLDNDGDEDILAVLGGAFSGDSYPNALFENPSQPAHWLTLRLVGTRANRAAVGARLHLTVEGPEGRRELHRTVGTGGSFGASSLQQEIALGTATRLVELEVRWPGSGTRQVFTNLGLGRVWQLVEGEPEPREVLLPRLRLGG